MRATIIGQNHKVTTYEVNGRKRYIIEDIPVTTNRMIVNVAIEECNSRQWATVYNHLDANHYIDKALNRAIDSMTY